MMIKFVKPKEIHSKIECYFKMFGEINNNINIKGNYQKTVSTKIVFVRALMINFPRNWKQFHMLLTINNYFQVLAQSLTAEECLSKNNNNCLKFHRKY